MELSRIRWVPVLTQPPAPGLPWLPGSTQQQQQRAAAGALVVGPRVAAPVRSRPASDMWLCSAVVHLVDGECRWGRGVWAVQHLSVFEQLFTTYRPPECNALVGSQQCRLCPPTLVPTAIFTMCTREPVCPVATADLQGLSPQARHSSSRTATHHIRPPALQVLRPGRGPGLERAAGGQRTGAAAAAAG